jgi:hypothetical protein
VTCNTSRRIAEAEVYSKLDDFAGYSQDEIWLTGAGKTIDVRPLTKASKKPRRVDVQNCSPDALMSRVFSSGTVLYLIFLAY